MPRLRSVFHRASPPSARWAGVAAALRRTLPQNRGCRSTTLAVADCLWHDGRWIGSGPGGTITAEAAGYPIRSLSNVPAGDYYVQAVLNIYQTFHRANGTTVKLAPDRGEGRHWNMAPGNLYCKPVKVHIDGRPSSGSELTEIIPPIAPPCRTRNTSATCASKAAFARLKFWGAPMYLSAMVLVPEGFR